MTASSVGAGTAAAVRCLPDRDRSCLSRVGSGLHAILLAGALLAMPVGLPGQAPAPSPGSTQVAEPATPLSPAEAQVEVNPTSRDDEIRARLERVLLATGWFTNPRVRVDEGVVFLDGTAPSDELKKWAGDLARRTQDVVAVVNRLEVPAASIWDFGPASRSLVAIWRDFVRWIPWLAFGTVILVLSLVAGWLASRGARRFLEPRVSARLLRVVLARSAGALVVLLGVYVILRVMGLTQLALTIVGGTGLIGLAVGIAFRDITENFLASIFLSVQRPFEPEDLIEVGDVTGYVQQLNMRTTILMNLDGNLVQIPNATVYKSNIRNYTANGNRREVFDVGIGYDDAVSEAQEIARRVLDDHPAVLNDPEPAVLVQELGTSTVKLRVYFWLDGRENSWLKVRSSVLRLVKREFQRNGISMPDEAREILFPHGVPVTMVDAGADRDTPAPAPPRASSTAAAEAGATTTKAEAGLYSDATVIREQARQAQPRDEGENLLKPVPDQQANTGARGSSRIHSP